MKWNFIQNGSHLKNKQRGWRDNGSVRTRVPSCPQHPCKICESWTSLVSAALVCSVIVSLLPFPLSLFLLQFAAFMSDTGIDNSLSATGVCFQTLSISFLFYSKAKTKTKKQINKKQTKRVQPSKGTITNTDMMLAREQSNWSFRRPTEQA